MLTVDPAIYTSHISAPRIILPEAIANDNGLRRRDFKDPARFSGVSDFRQYLADNKIPVGLVDRVDPSSGGAYANDGISALSKPYNIRTSGSAPQLLIPNRLVIHPMEGWDGGKDGEITEEVRRRWLNFAKSGAGLIWGFEAIAVRHDGRANPNQLVLNEDNFSGFKKLIDDFKHEFSLYNPGKPRPVIGFQLTHSGRFSSPNKHNTWEQRILYDSKLLPQKENAENLKDSDIEALIEDYVKAAKLAQAAGVDFVDLKHCHGYLGHEFLSGFDRPGKYGGTFENRTRFMRTLVERIREEVPGLHIGVRLSAFDFAPFVDNGALLGKPKAMNGARLFGNDGTPQGVDLEEPIRFLNLLEELGIEMVNVTAGSPYYNSHLQRPTHTPPKGAFYTPTDPIAMMALQMEVTAALKKAKPNLFLVGTGYSYAQEFFPHMAEYNVAHGRVDAVGYGRLAIPYPNAAADTLNGFYGEKIDPTNYVQAQQVVKSYYDQVNEGLDAGTLDRMICRALGICTNSPRHGEHSICPLQTALKSSDAFVRFQEIRKAGGVMPKQLDQVLDYAKLEQLLLKQNTAHPELPPRILDAAIFAELGLDYVPGLL